jgi:hypothetical protein
MNKWRGTILAVVMAGGVLGPAQESEAGLCDWLRCLRGRWCSRWAPSCPEPVVGCPAPVVQEGAYCAPCAPPVACSTSYVQRCYSEPRVSYVRQTALEARPTYVRRYYWDPCSVRYVCAYETATSYVRRSYYVPVTSYVTRSYLQPVTNCAPVCPTPACPVPTAAPAAPATNGTDSSSPAGPPNASSQPSREIATGTPEPRRANTRAGKRSEPLATGALDVATF